MMQRKQYQTLMSRIRETRKCIQVIEGPRQVGKSTLIKQVLRATDIPWLHFSTDNVATTGNEWISECWATARNKMHIEHLSELLLVIAYTGNFRVFYWRDGNDEVDFVLVRNSRIVAIEVKSNDIADIAGLHRFEEMFHPHRSVIVGSNGIPLETFLADDLVGLFQ